MLQSQVNYWNLVEQKRHNIATEQAANVQAEASMVSALASERTSKVTERLEPFERMKAQATAQQAEAALQNAATNRGNLEVNRANAAVNQQNADINQQNANVNKQNAATNARNAATNERNAAVNEWNASINEYNAMTNRYNADTNRIEAETHYEAMVSHRNLEESQIVQNRSETRLTDAKLPEQRERNAQAIITTQYLPAEKLTGIFESGSKTLSNITGSVHNVTSSVKELVTTKNSNSNKPGLIMSVSNLIDSTAGEANRWAAKNILGKIVLGGFK